MQTISQHKYKIAAFLLVAILVAAIVGLVIFKSSLQQPPALAPNPPAPSPSPEPEPEPEPQPEPAEPGVMYLRNGELMQYKDQALTTLIHHQGELIGDYEVSPDRKTIAYTQS